MTNTLGYTDQLKYSMAGLRVLENALGAAKACYRAYDTEKRTSLGAGSTIRIVRPTALGAPQALGTGTATALAPEGLEMTLSFAREKNFEVTDTDFAYSGQALIDMHIPRAIYSLVNEMDQNIWSAAYKGTPWVNDVASTTIAVADLAKISRILEERGVPIADVGNMWGLIGPHEREALIQLAAFSQQQGAAESGVNVQRTGQFSEPKYGFNLFSSANRPTHTPGTMADAAGVAAAASIGATSLSVSSVSSSGTVKAGDSFSIAGHTQRYVITADATATTGTIVLSFAPGLEAATAGSEVVTIDVEGTKVKQSVFMHSEYIAFAMGPLPEYSNMGAQIATATDPRTGLSVRTSYGWNQASKKLLFSVDILYGIKVLNPNMAVRSRQA